MSFDTQEEKAAGANAADDESEDMDDLEEGEARKCCLSFFSCFGDAYAHRSHPHIFVLARAR